MKKAIALTLVAACIFAGCSNKDEDETTKAEDTTVAEETEDTEATDTEVTVTTAESVDDTEATDDTAATDESVPEVEPASNVSVIYGDLISELQACRRGELDEDQSMALTDKISIDLILAPEEAVIYSTVIDIDGNGVDELLLYQHMLSESGEEVPVIYDAYTVTNGELDHFIAGGARNSYFLGADGYIYNMGSSGAAYSEFSRYAYADGVLTLTDAYFSDLVGDDVAWFYSSTDIWTEDRTESTFEEAEAFFTFEYQFIANEEEV